MKKIDVLKISICPNGRQRGSIRQSTAQLQKLGPQLMVQFEWNQIMFAGFINF